MTLALAMAQDTVDFEPPLMPVQGEVAEFRVDAPKGLNPYDPRETALDALITTPSGKEERVPGFWMEAAERSLENGQETVKLGEGGWRIRYSSQEAGVHQVRVQLRGMSGVKESAKPVVFGPGKPRVVVRISPRNPRHFETSDGASFFPIGANVCWGGARGTFNYDEWLPAYASQGANFARLWLAPGWSTFGLETKEHGPGRIDQKNAWRLDYVLQLAQDKGLKLKLCIESFNVLQEGQIYSGWADSPYNKANGGPLERPADFWTSPEADRLFRAKLRYLVARYGAYRSVFAWEFWNEVDLVTGFDPVLAAQWHQRMGAHLREADPYDRLITTSPAKTEGVRQIDLLSEMEFIQAHHYSSPDIVRTTADVTIAQRRAFPGKPHYFGEIGADWQGPRAEDDPGGIQIKDPMWASLAAGSSGAAMPWWWDNLIAPKNLYGHFGAVARFVKGIDFPGEAFQVRPARPAFRDGAPKGKFTDLALENGPVSWDQTEFNRPRTVRISAAGAAGQLPLAGIQHGSRNHPDKVNPVTFQVDSPRPIALVVNVLEVSGHGGAGLKVTVNGKEALAKDFPDPDENQSTASLAQFAGAYEVPLPAGKSTVVVSNSGNDWFRVDYRFRGLMPLSRPPLIGWVSVGKTKVIGWVRQAEGSWFNLCQRKIKLEPVPPSRIVLPLQKGRWVVELWDTTKGEVVREISVTSSGQEASVNLPAISHDLAIKAIRQR